MAITTGKLLEGEVRKNVFVIFIKTMIGDADGEGFLQIQSENNKEVEEDITFLRSLENESDFPSEVKTQLRNWGWPSEPYIGGFQRLDRFAVTFFDEMGNEREVFDGEENLSNGKKYCVP